MRNKKRILCFGDSNTWGFIPKKGTRYQRDVRWTGQLSNQLGSEYEIIEEGLNGRTTIFEDPFMPYRRGLDHLPMLIASHSPLDLIVISLGANDLKTYFNTTAWHSAKGIEQLIKAVRFYDINVAVGTLTPILVVSPTPYNENITELIDSKSFGTKEDFAYEKSLRFADEYAKISKLNEVQFLNAGDYSKASVIDGLHLDETGHKNIGEALYKKINSFL